MTTPNTVTETARNAAGRALLAHGAFVWTVTGVTETPPESFCGMASPGGDLVQIAQAIGGSMASLGRMARQLAASTKDPAAAAAFLAAVKMAAACYSTDASLVASREFLSMPRSQGERNDGAPH